MTKRKKVTKHSTRKRADHTAHAFHVIDGSELHSLRELADALHTMSDDSYYYHVTQDRNDFSTWINDIFHHQELAERIRHANRLEMECSILRFLLGKA